MRENSLVLFVTSVALRDNAVAAISMSFEPMIFPLRCELPPLIEAGAS